MTSPPPSVPDRWSHIQAPAFAVPVDAAEWSGRREAIRAELWRLFGDLPPRPSPPVARIVARERREGFIHERFELGNGAGAVITGHLLIPDAAAATPAPAVIVHHYHGGHWHLGKDEIFQTRAQMPAYSPSAVGSGIELVRRGYVVMATDAYAFGERNAHGPSAAERGGQVEHSVYKAMAWIGQSLWGMMVRDDQIALDWLAARPEVDAARIGATGFSMGSTRSWWLAALDERVRCVAGVCCLTRYRELVAAGGLAEHGIYYFVPGMLRHFDSEAVVSLIAPRRCLMLNGDADAGSPVAGIRRIDAIAQQVWRTLGAPDGWGSLIQAGIGHEYTAAMWRGTLDGLDVGLRA